MRRSNPHAYYLRNAVETASPARRVVMLFDGAIRFLSQALPAMAAKDYQAQTHCIECAQNIVAYLQSSLDRNAVGKLAVALDAVYVPLYDMLSLANIFDRPEQIERAIEVMRELREAWAEVDRQCQAGKSGLRETRELIAA